MSVTFHNFQRIYCRGVEKSRVYITAMMIRGLQRYLLFHGSKTTNKIIQPRLVSNKKDIHSDTVSRVT